MKTFQRLVVEPSQIRDRHIVLTSQQQHYLNRVLRLGVGDRFIAMDGQGHSWLAALANGDQAQILEPITVQSELPVAITLVAALPKGSGFDEVVRQSTELGVGCIAPVISDRTLLQPSPQKLERWRRIAQEAAEQSERQIVPTILEPVKFIQHLQNSNDTTIKYLCVARGNAPHLLHCLQNSPDSQLPALGRHKALPLPALGRHMPLPALGRHMPLPALGRHKALPLHDSLSIAIGPEGGWTDAEVERAIAVGYQPVSLGSRILRAVTAPLVALAVIAAVCESNFEQ